MDFEADISHSLPLLPMLTRGTTRGVGTDVTCRRMGRFGHLAGGGHISLSGAVYGVAPRSRISCTNLDRPARQGYQIRAVRFAWCTTDGCDGTVSSDRTVVIGSELDGVARGEPGNISGGRSPSCGGGAEQSLEG